MWCRECHREVAAVPTSSGSINCPFCGESTNGSNQQSISSTADTDAAVQPAATSKQLMRRDGSHIKAKTSSSPTLELSESSIKARSTTPMHHEDALGTIASQSWINLAGFCVVVFLCGQALVIWSFLAGHFGAWALGQSSLVVGITAALWLLIRQTATLADQNRVLTQRVNRLTRLTKKQSLESASSSPSNDKSRRTSSRKSATRV